MALCGKKEIFGICCFAELKNMLAFSADRHKDDDNIKTDDEVVYKKNGGKYQPF